MCLCLQNLHKLAQGDHLGGRDGWLWGIVSGLVLAGKGDPASPDLTGFRTTQQAVKPGPFHASPQAAVDCLNLSGLPRQRPDLTGFRTAQQAVKPAHSTPPASRHRSAKPVRSSSPTPRPDRFPRSSAGREAWPIPHRLQGAVDRLTLSGLPRQRPDLTGFRIAQQAVKPGPFHTARKPPSIA